MPGLLLGFPEVGVSEPGAPCEITSSFDRLAVSWGLRRRRLAGLSGRSESGVFCDSISSALYASWPATCF